MTTILQIRSHGDEDFRVDEVEAEDITPRGVRIKVAYNGICGTDLHIFANLESSGMPFTTTEDGSIIPVNLGHEYAGEVVEVGSNVETVAVGDNVAVIPAGSCGECASCQAGLVPTECANLVSNTGGMGEEVVVDQRHVFRLPAELSLMQGALVEPMAVAYHAVQIAEVSAGSTVVVAGAGPIGMGVVFGLRSKGVEKIIVSEPSAERRAIIEKHGVRAIDPANDDLQVAVMGMSGGMGAEAFIDAAGAPAVFRQGIGALGARGKYVVVAVHTRPLELNMADLQVRERQIRTSYMYTSRDFHDVIDAMVAGAYPTDGWVETRPATEVVEVIKELQSGKGSKVLLDMSRFTRE